MDEKPKSIWKKYITGRMALVIWLALTAFTIMLGSFISGLTNYDRPMSDLLLSVGIFTSVFLAIILFLIYVAWPLSRWFFWKHWRRTFFGLACFATLIGLLYAEEDWRGKHDWNKFKREWEAKGEHFDFASVIPPPVPDDQNFALTPIWVESMKAVLGPRNSSKWFASYAENGRTNFVDRLALDVFHEEETAMPKIEQPKFGNWQKGELTDLPSWQNYYRAASFTNRAELKTPYYYPAKAFTNGFPVSPQPQTPAQDVLLALSKYDSTIEELRAASKLPYSRFPLNYDGMPAAILLPHLAQLKRCAQVLELRAVAELQNGESEKALADVKLSLRLIDSVRTEMFLISHLVRIAVMEITIQPIYEGLAEHKWSDAQLMELDSELAKLNFLADYQFAIRGERALEIANIEFFRHPTSDPQFKRPRLYFVAPLLYLFQEMSYEGNDENAQIGFQMLALSFGPSGWIDQNELRIARFETKWYLPIVDENKETISPAKIPDSGTALGREIQHRTPENVLETLLIPALGGAARKCAYAQCSVDLARVAIALERYHLANGNYPESLAALAPQFLEKIPHDVINGEPLHYRRTDDGQFVLYSVGWNEKDDGGVVVFKKGSSPDANTDQGDWVWRYPAK